MPIPKRVCFLLYILFYIYYLNPENAHFWGSDCHLFATTPTPTVVCLPLPCPVLTIVFPPPPMLRLMPEQGMLRLCPLIYCNALYSLTKRVLYPQTRCGGKGSTKQRFVSH